MNENILFLLLLLSAVKGEMKTQDLLPLLQIDDEIMPILLKLFSTEKTEKEATMPEFKGQKNASFPLSAVVGADILKDLSAYYAKRAES